jgi:hypothetical protein
LTDLDQLALLGMQRGDRHVAILHSDLPGLVLTVYNNNPTMSTAVGNA